MLMVLVKADGRQDTIVQVDPDSPPDIDVPMPPARVKTGPPKPNPAGTIVMPPNPYD
jgi:hypothetical protein